MGLLSLVRGNCSRATCVCLVAVFVASTSGLAFGALAASGSPNEVLKFTTGRFCPSFWCGMSGYDIAGLEMGSDGKSIIVQAEDGSKNDSIAIANLKPSVEDVLGTHIVHFTGDIAPNLQTTDIGARRLLSALKAIRDGAAGVQAATVMTQSSIAGATDLAETETPSAGTSTTSPTSAVGLGRPEIQSASPVSPSALGPTSNGSPTATQADERISVHVLQECAADPDPLGLSTSDSDYSDCDQELLDGLRAKISSALSGRGFLVGDQTPTATLTVTLTLLMEDEGALGILEAGATGYHAEASYQFTDINGRVLNSGTVKSVDPDNIDDGDYGPVEDKLARDIVATLSATGARAQPASAATPAAARPVNTAPPELPAK